MGGLRFHAMLALTSDCILVHGGRNFKAKPKDNVNGHLYACLIVDGWSNWYNVPFLEVFIPRFGHDLVFHDSNLYVIGGFTSDQDNSIGNTQKLRLRCTRTSDFCN